MPNSSLKCRLKYLMVLNPVRSAISFTLHVVAFSNWLPVSAGWNG